jgi:chemotaxis protein CheX
MGDLIDQKTIVEMLRRATGEVLTTMLNMEPRVEEAYTEHPAQGSSQGVVSFVGLAGSQCVGAGSLHCSSEAACRLASRLLMSELEAVDDEVLDAFGELTNMIIGNFKNDVEERMGPMGLSIPTVIFGRNFSTRSLGREDWTVVPFLCGGDLLNVKACLKLKEVTALFVRHGDKQEFVKGY